MSVKIFNIWLSIKDFTRISLELFQEEKEKSGRARYNGRQFLSWLKDLDDKFEKLKVIVHSKNNLFM